MKIRIAFCATTLALALVLATPALADPVTFTYTSIDFPGAVASFAGGINNPGQIVGGYQLADGSMHGFRDVDGTFTTIDCDMATSGTEAARINNQGQIVGAYDDLNPPFSDQQFEGAHGFMYDAGVCTTIDFPEATRNIAAKINAPGNIVGVYRVGSPPGPSNGFLDVGGVFTTLNFPTSCCSSAAGINNGGDIVGAYRDFEGGPFHGFLDMGGTFTTIDFPGATDTIAVDINNSGDIVGIYGAGSLVLSFLDEAGTFSTIAFPGALATEALGINDNGDIVGFYVDVSLVIHGFVATRSPVPGTGNARTAWDGPHHSGM